jgi:hypothetical protein
MPGEATVTIGDAPVVLIHGAQYAAGSDEPMPILLPPQTFVELWIPLSE